MAWQANEGGQRTELRGRRSEDGGRAGSPAVNIAAMTDAEKMNRVLVNIDGVNDPVIAHSKPAAIGTF
jgi:hypothetical protein